MWIETTAHKQEVKSVRLKTTFKKLLQNSLHNHTHNLRFKSMAFNNFSSCCLLTSCLQSLSDESVRYLTGPLYSREPHQHLSSWHLFYNKRSCANSVHILRSVRTASSMPRDCSTQPFGSFYCCLTT